MSIQPHKIENFNEALFEEVALREQFRSKIYLDSVGIPTIGYGHAFFIADGSKNIDAFKELESMGISLSKDDLWIFDKIEELLKKHPRDIKAIKKLMEKIDLEIDESVAKELFDYGIEKKMDGLKERLGDELYTKLEDSKELLALADLAFNGGPGLIYDSMLKALKEGDREEVWYKIRYATNGKTSRSKGIANRRVSESDIFGLTNEKPTAEDISNIEKMMQAHSANIYKQEHAFTVTRHSPSPNPYAGKQSMKEQLKIAKHHFLHAKDNEDEDEGSLVNRGIKAVGIAQGIKETFAKKSPDKEKNHFRNLPEDDDLVDSIEKKIDEVNGVAFDKEGNIYMDAVLLSGVKHIKSDGIYEDTMFTYTKGKDGLLVSQKEDPDNTMLIVDWNDEATQETLGIILDDSPLVKEDSIHPKSVEEYLSQFSSRDTDISNQNQRD